MRSERASRVCIVVLEEVEEDESSSSSPPPQPKSSPDRRSHHASRRAAAQEDKVRWALLFGSLLIEFRSVEFVFLPHLRLIPSFCVDDSKQATALLIPALKFEPVLKCIVTRPTALKYNARPTRRPLLNIAPI